MGKTFHFLAGLHRSGNTVLSSILNQNPDIYVSPISALVEHMWVCHTTVQNFESAQVSSKDKQRSINMISKMTEGYYSDTDKPIVFDRNKAWINSPNIQMIKTYVTEKPKIVFTTRPVIEMMASFIAIAKDTIIDDMNDSNFSPNEDLPMNDNLADFLYSEHSNFGKQLIWAFESIDNIGNAGIIHVVKYEDLLNTPQKTMNEIYDFLEIESFQHNFKNIKNIEEYNEAAAGLPKDLHRVRQVLGKSDVRVEDYLTPRSIEKYKDVRYF